jgi:hypothetical protein
MSESHSFADPIPPAAKAVHPSAPSLSTDPSSPLREAWLHHGVEALTPIFKSAGHLLPTVRVSCGFASTGLRSNHIGQCWSRSTAPTLRQFLVLGPPLCPVHRIDMAPLGIWDLGSAAQAPQAAQLEVG